MKENQATRKNLTKKSTGDDPR